MTARTNDENKAYVDGYNDCYNQFMEYLRKKPYAKALTAMECIVVVVNGTFALLRGEEDE